MADPAEQLIARIGASGQWPPKWETCWEDVRVWAAMRDGDGAFLRAAAGWDTAEHRGRNYIVDSMPGKISGTFSELVFGDDPTITAASEADQDRLDYIVEQNQLPSELQTAGDTCSSEGEVWYRLLVDRDRLDCPIIEWHSRLNVLPVFRGRQLVAAALVSSMVEETSSAERPVIWRYFEIHAQGVVRNALWKGATDRLGQRRPLAERPETADLPEDWQHGLPMLVGRNLNKRGRSPRLGVSDYRGVKDYLFALNEVATIGQENARLTLKRRVVVPDTYLDVRGQFPAGADVIVKPTTDMDPDKPDGGLAQVEWSFDASAFIAYKGELERTILGRVGLAKQLVDAGNPSPDGRATGTALRLRLIPTVLATNGKARFWDDTLPKVLALATLLDKLPDEGMVGGFNYKWTSTEPPTVERSAALPQDETEEATRHATLVTAEIESRRQAIAELHPEWVDEQIDAELALIAGDLQSQASLLPAPDARTGSGDPALA